VNLETGFEGRSARIEMIPLMDVVFLLLVFFIYAMFTMTVHRGVRVDLPQGAGQPAPDGSLTITLTRDGAFQLDGRPLARDDLLLEVVDLHRVDRRPVLISADRQVPLGMGIELLDRLRQAGIEAVTFQVTPEARP
jgi:biopolymer transport protein ExbD